MLVGNLSTRPIAHARRNRRTRNPTPNAPAADENCRGGVRTLYKRAPNKSRTNGVQVVDKSTSNQNCTKVFVRFFFERVGAKKEAKASRNSVLRNFSPPQICFAEFAQRRKGFVPNPRIASRLRRHIGISPSAGGNFCEAKFPAVYRLATKGLLALDPANF